MKRILASLMLVTALSSCDEDEVDPPISESRDPIMDGGSVAPPLPVQDAGLAADAAADAKVTNVGESCSGVGRDCHGSAAQCLEVSYSGAFYAGGYCTADCKSNAECGPQGECPVPEAMHAAPTYAFRSTWARKCFRSCTPGVPGECRAGYGCLSLAEAYEAHDAPAALQRPVCIPRKTSSAVDAGMAPSRALDAGR